MRVSLDCGHNGFWVWEIGLSWRENAIFIYRFIFAVEMGPKLVGNIRNISTFMIT